MPSEHNDVASSRRGRRVSPFPSSKSQSVEESTLLATCTAGSQEDAKEWEDVICPVCLDIPHNAVLLLCSSHDNGCRPYMCNTGHRHSNCLDCFREAFAAKSPSTTTAINSHGSSHSVISGDTTENNGMPGVREEALHHVNREREDKKMLTCPLCRGKIKGWTIVEGARHFMDAKPRACALESCGFSGTYRELRLHVRVEHPLACPSKADPDRAHSWTMLERQHHLADMIGARYVVADGHDGGWDAGLRSDEDYWSFLTISLLGLLDPSIASSRLTASSRVGRWTRRLRRRIVSSNQEGLPGSSNEGEMHGGGGSSSDGSVADLSTSSRTSG